jgi:hypothetical protein
MKSERTSDRVYPYRFGNISGGLLILALSAINLASLLPPVSPLRVKSNSLTDIRDCLIEVALG